MFTIRTNEHRIITFLKLINIKKIGLLSLDTSFNIDSKEVIDVYI